ncbi:Crp/Fnr family transcriptional regulator [Dactylosporangium matsuzakiense]|uniref:Crp/Fnr family transcriptional regulator n=1 Tax=Dactylosporangium matsuzakiense TaxID=53360 RepID=A0A9W6KGY8_9ACTN|nr:Crp/Fnr family transcriptional regulator [Dactylosporangium matsuzakiense]UWZ42537.1 Crp/Fnr family transcriptional regulator [Dactylosporangium matsuzakiense]GLL00544.1 Crp/Fnr family transcriptional regulator [Dactylosporangium matsuzakiense]
MSLTVLESRATSLDSRVLGAALLDHVGAEAADDLAAEFETVEAGRRTVLFREGEPGDRLYVLRSGKVKLSRRSSDGREGLLALVGPGEPFGEVELLDGGPRTTTATVVADARLAQLSKTSLYRWMGRHPQVAEQLLQAVARRIRGNRATVHDRLFSDVPGRVAGQLMQLAYQFGVVENGTMRVVHDLTQTELAQFVGASRESVNKVLAHYASRGWLRLENKCIVILDDAPLARRAQHKRRR